MKKGSGLCFCKSEAGMTEVGRQGGKAVVPRAQKPGSHQARGPADRPPGGAGVRISDEEI